MTNIACLPYGRYRFTLSFERAFIMPPVMTSLLRSVLGMALRNQVCVFRRLECAECPLLSQCVYPEFFETEAKAGTNRLAVPYILSYPIARQVLNGTMQVEFVLTLIGDAITKLPYLVHAFEQAGLAGIRWSTMTHSFLVSRVTDDCSGNELFNQGVWLGEDWQKVVRRLEIPEIGDSVVSKRVGLTIDLRTPFRAKSDNQIVRRLDAQTLLDAAVRRLQLVIGKEANAVLTPYRIRVNNLADSKETLSSIEWQEFQRYSARQGSTMRLGGLVGKVRYEGDFAAFKPLLEAAKVVHIGKQAAFGFGEFDFQFCDA
jgi:hypothetical protein